MPVTTRSISIDKPELSHSSDVTDANMAAKTKQPTVQDILSSIDHLETKNSIKLDAQIKILQESQNVANKKIENKIDNMEKGLSDQSDTMTLLQNKCDRQQETITN